MKHKVVFEFNEIINDDNKVEDFVSLLSEIVYSDLNNTKCILLRLENQGIQTTIESGD